MLIGATVLPTGAISDTDPILTAATPDLLQTMIRNECVNDGTVESGEEVRNSDLLETFLEGSGLDCEHYESAPGRRRVGTAIRSAES